MKVRVSSQMDLAIFRARCRAYDAVPAPEYQVGEKVIWQRAYAAALTVYTAPGETASWEEWRSRYFDAQSAAMLAIREEP